MLSPVWKLDNVLTILCAARYGFKRMQALWTAGHCANELQEELSKAVAAEICDTDFAHVCAPSKATQQMPC